MEIKLLKTQFKNSPSHLKEIKLCLLEYLESVNGMTRTEM